jgi:hypothetical protein
MRELSTEIEIKATAEKVWAILTDLSRFREWNPFITRGSGDIREGSKLTVRIEPPGGKPMIFKPTVTRVVPNRDFRWLGRVLLPGLFDGEHIFELSASTDGRTRFVQREQFSGLLVPLLWNSLTTRTRRGFEAMNAALKKRAEGL